MQIYYKKCNYKICKHKKCKKYLKSDKMREIDLSIFLLLRLPNLVGDHLGQHHRQFHEAGILVAVVPRGLEDELFDALLLYCIDVCARMLQHIGQQASGWFGMAVQYVLADDFRHSGLQECLLGFLVHVQYRAVLGANSHGHIGPLKVVSFHGFLHLSVTKIKFFEIQSIDKTIASFKNSRTFAFGIVAGNSGRRDDNPLKET